MIGSVVSDTGRFRVTWEARRERVPGEGRFQLTVHSAVSGRLIEAIVDHRGEGGGTVTFADEPKIYDLVVTSDGVDWEFNAEEVPRGSQPSPGEVR